MGGNREDVSDILTSRRAVNKNSDTINNANNEKEAIKITKHKKKLTQEEKGLKHSMLGACSCKQGCWELISAERQLDINKQYWMQTLDSQRSWIYQTVEEVEI